MTKEEAQGGEEMFEALCGSGDHIWRFCLKTMLTIEK
jgi:hypothetical protein